MTQDTGWIDRSEYPFAPHSFSLGMGRMHYIDEGQGRPLVMVHGTPTWSFLYRHLVKGLSDSYRCIVPDHIGFGLSDKPEDWSYRPPDHAQNLRALIEHLGLHDIVLVVHDFGGSIGLSYAIEQPDNVRGIVVFNSWLWSLHENRQAVRINRLMAGRLGDLLYKRLNFSARVLVPLVMGERAKLTKTAHRHYINVVPHPQDRQGMLTFARELVGSSVWYDTLWQRRGRISDHPALLLWGMKDPGVRAGVMDLSRWQQLFTRARIMTFPTAGHFVQEEEATALVPIIRDFLRSLEGGA